MKTRIILQIVAGGLLALSLVWPAGGEENVTIPKARLEELERKERELDKLSGELKRAREDKARLADEQKRLKNEARELRKAREEAEAKAAQAGVASGGWEQPIPHETPSLASLPGWRPGDVVEAMDLMNHYRKEPASAARRYETHKIRVRGKIVGFENAPFIRTYSILLQTTERAWKVVCKIEPPANYSAVFTGKHGEELIGSTSGGARAVLARQGQTAVIEGYCKGLKDQSVSLSTCRLISVE